MKTMVGLMAGAAMLMTASAANAAVYDFRGTPAVDNLPQYNFNLGGGVTGTVTSGAEQYFLGCFGFCGSWSSVSSAVTQNENGLGVNAWNWDLDFDGTNASSVHREWLRFDFSEAVTLHSIAFDEILDGLIGGGGGGYASDWTINVDGQSNPFAVDSTDNPFYFGDIKATWFEVVADHDLFLDWDSWRVAELDATVPLPAAVWFMLTALGGLAGTRWLKKGAKAAAA